MTFVDHSCCDARKISPRGHGLGPRRYGNAAARPGRSGGDRRRCRRGCELDTALVTACEDARSCPGCGQRSSRSLGLVTTGPRDVPLGRRRTLLHWTKRRWACQNTACRRRSFTESLPSIPPRSRLTARLRTSAGEAVADGSRTVLQSARDHELSWPTVNAAFTAHAKAALPAQTPPVEHLGIDETRRGKAKFGLVTGPDGADV